MCVYGVHVRMYIRRLSVSICVYIARVYYSKPVRYIVLQTTV